MLKNWLFVIPDGVGEPVNSRRRRQEQPAGGGMGGSPHDAVMNNTNLRTGNLHQANTASMAACAALCDATPACQAWVYADQKGAGPPSGLGANQTAQATSNQCYLKNSDFCVNAASDPCGGCVIQGECQCTAGVKRGVAKRACPAPPPPGPAPHKVGRACGRMGFASASLNGPYKHVFPSALYYAMVESFDFLCLIAGTPGRRSG